MRSVFCPLYGSCWWKMAEERWLDQVGFWLADVT